MLRSMYSGISGLQIHQTKMDVIGNNISNVNTIGFKSSNVNFADILYQTSQNASGPTNISGGTNPKQIGLGGSVNGIASTITSQGGAQRTDSGLDVMINGNAFFIVNNNGNTLFTKNGAFKIDKAGNLATESGALVLGWGVDPNTGEITSGQVKKLDVYANKNRYVDPEPTTDVVFSGNIDELDEELSSGKATQLEFYDNLGYKYTVKCNVKKTDTEGQYTIDVTDIMNSQSETLKKKLLEAGATDGKYKEDANKKITFAGIDYVVKYVGDTAAQDTTNGNDLKDFELRRASEGSTDDPAPTFTFNTATGKFSGVLDATGNPVAYNKDGNTPAEKGQFVLDLKALGVDGASKFGSIKVDFSSMTMFNSDGVSTISSSKGSLDGGQGAGCMKGKLTGVSISNNGMIYGAYNNGRTKLLGQIAVADFVNPAGLEAVGTSMYTTTLNSGDFDGIGVDITTTGGKMTSGVLELSNVDLSQEFTNMVTAQRGFQANSRVITTSDTLLEELVNLKR